MPKIIGIRSSSFKGNDGTEVQGTNFYFTYPLDKGEGCGADRAYLTASRLSQLGYVPKVGDEVEVIYNRFGKCSEFRRIEGKPHG